MSDELPKSFQEAPKVGKDFDDANRNIQKSGQAEAGEGSRMVKQDQPKPELRMKGPMGESVDKQTHNEQLNQERQNAQEKKTSAERRADQLKNMGAAFSAQADQAQSQSKGNSQ